jgi:hypothetical protein
VRLALALCLISSLAWAGPVKVVLEPGQVAPVRGCFLDERSCIATGQEVVDLRARVAHLEAAAIAPPPLTWALVAGAVLGLAVGYGVARMGPAR